MRKSKVLAVTLAAAVAASFPVSVMAAAKSLKLGDVNGDGVVSIPDVTAIQRYAAD